VNGGSGLKQGEYGDANNPIVSREDVSDLALLPRRFDALALRVEGMADQGVRILELLANMGEHIADIRNHQADHTKQISTVTSTVEELRGEVRDTHDCLERRMVRLEARIAQLELAATRKRNKLASRTTSRRRRTTRKRAKK
jgi:septal ring factor EnvC (AmiA/AmiB activator)